MRSRDYEIAKKQSYEEIPYISRPCGYDGRLLAEAGHRASYLRGSSDERFPV